MALRSLSDIDLCDLDRWEKGFPHEVFVRLRREAPVWWHPRTTFTPDDEGFWVVSRHADVARVFQDPRRFSSVGFGARPRGGTFLADMPSAGVMLNMMDDPRHRRIRGLVSTGFTPRVIRRLEAELRRRAALIVEAAGAGGRCEFVRQVARELPLQAICMLLGVPQSDRSEVCDWVDQGLEVEGKLGESTPRSREATGRLAQYGQELIARKRAEPADDMLSLVAHAELPGEDPPRLGDDELQLFFLLLFTAGSETTRKAIAGGLLALLRAPEQLSRLREDPRGRLPAAVEEIVRWTTPSAYKRRTATEDVELGGEKIRAGDKVTVWEMSANRDETVFADPFRFDVARDPNPHLGFGLGIHFCLGANLARLEMRILFEELLGRWPRMALAGEPTWTRDNRLFGLKTLPLEFEAEPGGGSEEG